MSPSLRFLALALVGWGVLRAATLDKLPGRELFAVQPSEARVPPIVPTQFAPIEPIAPQQAESAGMMPGYPYVYGAMPQSYPVVIRPMIMPAQYPGTSLPAQPSAPTAEPLFYGPIPGLDDWTLPQMAQASRPARRSAGIPPTQSVPAVPAKPALDRLQLTAWALMRGQQGQPLGPSSLANGGQLGGGQAGARLSIHATRQIAGVLRTSTDVGRRGGEVAAGLRVQPVSGLPVWITAERRQRIGRAGTGRNAFALFAEAGLYQSPLPWGFALDAYLQGGVVGVRSRDAFADGALAISRPVFGRFSAGAGAWGGVQPGLYRLDAGPRVSMKVRDNVRIHLDWRQRVAGNAAPGSGPAVTLAGNF
ncbi:hypothetical protein H9L13_01030 [Sphingomonas lutea]|uniref:Uncharacterized protein n=1 Tax=Sphingomonas lutea TaxID=1045317 RepID=A0A7G9SIA2_9SPHN|nr:hypothetical protein [Sphingomonas lutea]QNN67577.1 hypothetical protein H9L13_01030 [Sphingomonas lutea]